jgi:hypothetical protein
MMSEYFRGSLPDGEGERLHSNALKIRDALRERPRTNKWISVTICLDYRRRINELRRKHGYHIKATRLNGRGIWEYRLLDRPEPEYTVRMKLIAPDGQFLIYSQDVNASTETEARNNAPRKYVRTEILSVRKKEPPSLPVRSPKPLHSSDSMVPFESFKP